MNDVSTIRVGVPGENSGYRRTLTILGVVFLVSTALYCYSLLSAPTVAGWAFLVVNFIFILGISQYGVAFTAIMRICGVRWARPYYRVGEVATLAFLPFAFIGLIFIFVFGSAHLFYWLEPAPDAHLSPWLNSTFLLWRNLLAQIAFYGFVIVYFLAGLIPEVTAEDAAEGPSWRQGLYRWLLAQKEKRSETQLKHFAYFYSPIVLVAAIFANSFIAWDFAMMLIEHYHSTIFPMHFIVGCMLAGTAGLLFLALALTRSLNLGAYFQTAQVHNISIVMTGFTLLWLYMLWAQFFVSWYGNLPHEWGVIANQVYGHYSPFFWTMILFVFMIPLVCLIFLKFKQTWWTMLTLALIINVGMWCHRYLIVMPELVEGHVPFSSLAEVAMLIGLLSGYLCVLYGLFNVFPMVSRWELQATEEGVGYPQPEGQA